MKKHVYRAMIELTNGKWSSILISKFAKSKISRAIIPSFAKIYKINVDEMEGQLHDFPTLHDFFIRRLKQGARKVNEQPTAVVSPVDAVMEDCGTITTDLQLLIKGKRYSVIEMLGSEDTAQKYIDGKYVLLYLSPSHYHRIHSPFSGIVLGQWTLGNKSYPVNKSGIKYGKRTLSKNYRKVTEIKHAYGIASVVKVGAMFVNSIETIHQGEQVQKGEEIAYFTFGSTVVLLFEKDSFEPAKELLTPANIKVGEIIGSFIEKDKEY